MAGEEAEISDLPVVREMLIGGSLEAGHGDLLTVINPGTGQPAAAFPGASPDQFRAAIAAARRAYDDGRWAGLTRSERVAILDRFLAAVRRETAGFRSLVVAETGCPAGSMVLDHQVNVPLEQVQGALGLFLALPEIEENPLPLHERVTAQGNAVQSFRRYVPVGVVSAITAYNFPINMALWKLVPALAAGNCLVLRPSPLTPLSALALARAAEEAGIPPGVLNIVAEAGSEGAVLMTTDPDIDMVAFTGSTGVGMKVMEQAAATMKRLQLELGGKSAQIYLPDRLEAATYAALSVLMGHAGQGCVLGTRIFVPEEAKEELLKSMTQPLAALRIGDPLHPSTVMSPVVSQAQLARCERYVQLAVDAGARIVTGGKTVARPGFYFEPTILDVPDNSNPAAQDEIFGPVVCVIGYRDIDHAVEMANDSSLGLSGYVFGKDTRRALEVATRLRTGTVNVNGAFASAFASSGGHKHSGVGRERGVEGFRIYQDIQCVNLQS